VEIERYSQDEMAKDIAGLIEALGHKQAIIVGHDLGASLTWQICLLYPEKVKAVIALSIPYGGRALAQPIPHMKIVFSDKFFYILYFQQPGVAERELDADVYDSLLRIYFSLGAEGSEIAAQYVANDNPISAENYLDTTIRPKKLPNWFKAEDFAYYVGRYEKKGFRGILNWYRCLDIYWKRTEHLAGKKITQPTYFIGGNNDPINYMVRKAIKRLPNVVEDLRGVEFFDDCGHWIPCEQTELLNEKLLKYIGEVVGMK
jgi:pimeloyl-ACP methyl ester carboxylesterase